MAGDETIIWLVTGEIAEKTIRTISARFSGTRVTVAPVSVASFLTAKNIKALLSTNSGMDEGIIVLPGTIRWDPAPLARETGCWLVKGPRNITDLPPFLKTLRTILTNRPGASLDVLSDLLEHEKASMDQERDSLASIVQERAEMLDQLHASPDEIPATLHEENVAIIENLKKPGRNFSIPGTALTIGKDFPPVIMAEIANAAEKAETEIAEQAGYFLRSGAQVIDVGATPGKSNPGALGCIISAVIDQCKCPVSIDSLDEKEILAGVDAGAKIILSIDQGNQDVLASLGTDVVLVLIPTNIKGGHIPRQPRERVDALASLVLHARDLGFTRIIADPILNSPITPGMMESLEAFTMFQHEADNDPGLDVPLFIGGSNVSEMIDADSAGVNALLAIMGVELGAAILFTSEESAKCTGSVREMRAARDMAFMARTKNAHPKDLAYSALVTKKKHKAIPLFDVPEDGTGVIDAGTVEGSRPFTLDPSGVYFKLFVDHVKGRIFAGAFDGNGMITMFQGTRAEAIGKEILARFEMLSKDHVLYIGRELVRAEDCLISGASYIQDEV
ncbi:MAG TPA: DUF4346 domain-containing protein [Candidatus Lokiarchaeia archaeon]|nr:DUF4346 domain-containing protein [Candidatus Lokiarchaeia archaeon]